MYSETKSSTGVYACGSDDDCCSDGGYCPGSVHISTKPKSDLSQDFNFKILI